MSRSIRLPEGSKVIIAFIEQLGGVAVTILPPGASSVTDVLHGAPRLSAAVTHDAGLSWPDAAGCKFAQAAIDGGGFVALQFVNFDDAELCRKRLEQSRAGAR